MSALEELPALTVDGVVIANELLDNLPFDVVERTADGWLEIRVGVTDTGAVLRGAGAGVGGDRDLARRPRSPRRVPASPVQRAVEEWIDDCATRCGAVSC